MDVCSVYNRMKLKMKILPSMSTCTVDGTVDARLQTRLMTGEHRPKAPATDGRECGVRSDPSRWCESEGLQDSEQVGNVHVVNVGSGFTEGDLMEVFVTLPGGGGGGFRV